MSSISFIVATTCRQTVAATLKSIECWPGDEIIVVSAYELNLHMQDFARGPYIKHMSHPAGNDWGHTERNFAMQYAKGQYVAHLDDDDTYVINHRVIMAGEILRHPSKPLIFKMQYHKGDILWRDKIVRVGNVGTPMTLLPNHQLGQFGSFYGGDMLYAEQFASNHGLASEDFIWSEEITTLIRPHLA